VEAWQHPPVEAYRTSRVRFQTVHAGRRSFKTELAKRRLVSEAFANAGKRYFAGGPTRDQAKRIFWNDLKALVPDWAKQGRPVETDLRIDLKNKSEIHVLGFDKPERFEGTPWDGGILTEFPHFKATTWNENIAPALRDTKGWAIIEGVPEGRNHYYELSQYARQSGDPEWADFAWKTADVRDPVEIEKERARLDERTFRQEYEGSFESYEGRAYVYYDPDTHRKSTAYLPNLPVCIACDFNLDPCIWEIVQASGTHVRVLDEIKQRQTDIWKMCGEAKLRLERTIGKECRNHRVIFYGDFEHGQARSVSATASSWQILRNEFAGWDVKFCLRGHPRIVDRVNAVNSKMRNSQGKSFFQLDPKCIELHKDFEMVSLENLQTSTDVGDRTHASDALGYMIDYEWPVKPRPLWSAS
jgi:hypothetical protein